MKTLGSRLTTLHLSAVACTVLAVLFVGRYVMERHLVGNLDATLQARFLQLKDRLGTDTESDDVRSLLAASGIGGGLSVQVEDLWNDPAYRAARTAGAPIPEPSGLRFFTDSTAGGALRRVSEGTSESLKIRLSMPLEPIQRALNAYTRVGVAIAALVFLVSVAIGPLLSRFALQPVRLIERTAARIGSENLSERIPVGNVNDEISNLARLLNNTFARLESSFDQIKRFAADASHELKTPLSVVRLNLERVVLKGRLAQTDCEDLQDAIEELNHLNRLIENMLFLSRAEAGEVELQRSELEARTFVDGFRHDAEILAEASGARFSIDRNEAGSLSVDPGRIKQILLNLLSNAVKFTPEEGCITLDSWFSGGSWHLSLTDEGPGVPEERLGEIFHRFVRISRTQAHPLGPTPGAGLGLAISKSLAELHGGTLWAENRRDRSGLRVECRIPISSEVPKRS